MSHLPVLIVGAGPTGLMMANELKRHNIPFRIIDKNAEQTQGSNATWIQTRTLEIFDTIGMIDSFLKIGHKCHTINGYVKGKCSFKMPLNNIDSTYPFILMLPQKDTEHLLNKKLNDSKIYVERSHELINVKQTNGGIFSTIKLFNGDTETITSDWLIACDGANSTVRSKCQIAFPGENISEQFMVADAELNSFLPTDEIHVFFDKGTVFPEKATIFSAFPCSSKRYRLIANLYNETPRQIFHVHEVEDVVFERTYENYIVKNISWISPFWIHDKMVDNMQYDAIFLLGDAAHIHSPAGGQGMNTGIQDAFNLAWKLALVIKGKANKTLLNSCQKERFPIVKNIVKQTDFYTNMFLFDKSFFSKLKKFGHELLENSHLSQKIGQKLTQIDIYYKKSPVINYEIKPNAKSPKQGKRAPDVSISHSKKLSEYLSNSMHNILLFTSDHLTKHDLKQIQKLQNIIENKFSDIIKMFVITNKNLDDVNNIIIDETKAIHYKYNVNHLCTYIIRPDNYIAYYGNGVDLLSIEKFFKNYLIIN